MKKFFAYTFALMTTLFTMTSCDDQRIANTLEGTWSGNMYISSYYDGRVYDATYSEVTFLKDPYAYSSGAGYWVDYYSDAPWDYIANHIEWTVDYGTIKVYFVEERTTIMIRDYHLDNAYFYGTINDNGRPVDFRLEHVSGRNWSSYRWGYEEWYIGTRSTDSTGTRKIEKPVRFVRSK
jgi:hypothetical protein